MPPTEFFSVRKHYRPHLAYLITTTSMTPVEAHTARMSLVGVWGPVKTLLWTAARVSYLAYLKLIFWHKIFKKDDHLDKENDEFSKKNMGYIIEI